MTRLLFLSACCAGCTALVQFRDAVDPCADGGCADAARDSPAEASALDAGPVVDAAHICKGAAGGHYCGFNSGLKGRAPSPDDLVFCQDGGATITRCDAGCVYYPSGIPDMCNTCGDKQGRYCNGQLGPQGQGVKYLTLCNGGQQIPQTKCANACVPGPGDASCQ